MTDMPMNQSGPNDPETNDPETSDLGTMDSVRDLLVLAALPQVPFDGWTWKTLRNAAQACGFDASMAERAFPGGAVAAVEHLSGLADRRAADVIVESASLSDRVAELVRQRLEPWADHREALRRALALMCLPGNAAAAMRANWRTADTLWYAAGDRSADFSYYTKRASLAALFAATLLFWLDDSSEGAAATWDFWARQQSALRLIPQWQGRIRAVAAGWTPSLSGLSFPGLARRRGLWEKLERSQR